MKLMIFLVTHFNNNGNKNLIKFNKFNELVIKKVINQFMLCQKELFETYLIWLTLT